MSKRRLDSLIINALYNFIGGLIYPSIPLYLELVGVGIRERGYVLSALNAIGFAASILWGRLIKDEHSMRRIAIFNIVSGAVGYIALIYPLGTTYVIAVLLALSALTGGIGPVIMTAISEDEDVAGSFGYYWMGGSVGYAIATSFSGYIIGSMGMRPIFAISAVAYASSILLINRIILGSGKFMPNRVSRQAASSINGLGLYFMALYTVSIFMLLFIDVVKNLYIPPYYAFNVKIGTALATMTLSVEAFLEIPLIMLISNMVRSGNMNPVTGLGASLALASMYLAVNALFVHNTPSAFLAMSTYSVVWATYSVSSSVLAPLAFGGGGLAYGIYVAIFPLANIVAPVCMSYLIADVGYVASLIDLSILMMALSAVLFTTAKVKGWLASQTVITNLHHS